MKLSVVIPAYNEEGRISSRLKSITEYFNKVRGDFDYELLVVMDGCTDDTPRLVSTYAGDCSVKPLLFPERLGKGGALIEGLKHGNGDVFLMADADDSVPAEDLLMLAKEAEEHGFAIGSRYVEGSRVLLGESFARFFLGRAFNAIVRLMFWRLRRIKDTQCGSKAISRSVLEKVRGDLFIVGFAFDVNLIYSAMRHGFKVEEVGITWRHVERGSKASKALAKLALGMFFSLIKLRLYYSRFKCILDTSAMKRLSNILWKITKA